MYVIDVRVGERERVEQELSLVINSPEVSGRWAKCLQSSQNNTQPTVINWHTNQIETVTAAAET